ncbi:alcohol oxidase [Tricholoma matsutake]|nr:alcohol oxidase [Tricholoma matsutake 945]
MSVSDNLYDVIFAGGGSAACVTAGRLAAADPSLKILILEAGPHTKDVAAHVQPALAYRNVLLPAESFTFHMSKPGQAIDGRSIVVAVPRCLGGGSSGNFMMYTRAAASDYDDWESVYENPGWGSKDLIPLLKKAETYEAGGPVDLAIHGTSGPLKISLAEDEVNIATQFLDVAAKYDKERGLTDDVNDFVTCDVYGRWLRFIDKHSGRRSDTAHHYIYNQSHNQNLKVLDRSRVVRIIFEGTRAVGVEYVNDHVGRSKSGTPETSFVKAARLVVVSAGAFGSPAILERSGIGGADVLQKNNIPQVVDLPGVGEHFMDHHATTTPFFASEDADTLDVLFRGEEAQLEPFVSKWRENGQGLMSHNGFDAGIKIRPNSEDLKEIGLSFEARWKSYFANAPDKPVMWIGTCAGYMGGVPAAPGQKYFVFGYLTNYPESVGRVHIKSGLDAYAPLDFDPRILDRPADLDVLRWAYKKAREFGRRMTSYRGEFAPGHPSFPEGSQAACKVATGPVDVSSPDIVYSSEDNEAIDAFHRKTIGPANHCLGTCSMRPREQGGVVDARLNVYGIQSLKVVDFSIAPANVGANPYNTVVGIGEKAALIIVEDLGIKGVESNKTMIL